MADRIDAWLKVEADSVPDADVMAPEEWRARRDSGGFYVIGKNGRGAWISEIHTYLRGAKWLNYVDGGLVDLADEYDVADGRIAFERGGEAEG